MIILDKPYVSELLQSTLEKNQFPVVESGFPADLLPMKNQLNLVSSDEAVALSREDNNTLFYSNSENSIAWIEQNLQHTALPEKIRLFKNKIAFRELIRDIYPDYYFRGIAYNALDTLDIKEVKLPCIIKPAIGFFSMGVYKIDTAEEWPGVLSSIHAEIEKNRALYPTEVYNPTDFIIEECIQGDEYAVDVYFDEESRPVILNIMEHVFSSGKDVSDRLYFTSKRVIKKQMTRIEAFLKQLGERAGVKNFPSHIEVRIDEQGVVIPIEVNPMRFGGWCSSSDMAWYAFGINEYEYFFNRKKPDWEQILEQKDEDTHCILILDNSTGVEGEQIASFNYEQLMDGFREPLSMRRANFKEYPVFGLLFVKSESENSDEVRNILKSNLREFIEERVISAN